MIKVTEERVEDLLREARRQWAADGLNFSVDDCLVCISEGAAIIPFFNRGKVVPLIVINADDDQAIDQLTTGKWESIKDRC